jgi:O-antigen/teichoic acid export membrane protein
MFEAFSASLTEGGRIARNTLWNLAGQVAPLLVAVFAIPVLISGLGIDRFGLLSIVWMVIGYFSLFDLGLGRALIKLLSEKLGKGRGEEIPELVWTALFLMVILGAVGAGAMLTLSDWLVASVFKIPAALQGETSDAFRLLAWSVPIVILTTGLRGILEAYLRFDLVNIVRVPMGILTFVGPIATLPFSNRLDVVVMVLLGLRILLCLVHAALCEWVVPGLLRRVSVSRRHMRQILGFGGWMTVTNVIGPLMIYIDRFAIGSVISMAAVAYYVTPYEVITKLLVIPGALVGVLFPAFSASFPGDRFQATGLFLRGVRWVFLVLFPVVLMATVFASDGLRLWLSEEFSRNGTAVLQWLTAGVLLNSLAQIPFAFIQGTGRPDLTAKLHLAEIPFYLLGLWVFLSKWGLVGAAAAWTLRCGFDAVALFALSALLEKDLWGALKWGALVLVLALAVLALGSVPGGSAARITFAPIAMASFIFLAWRHLLLPDERAFLRRRLSSLFGINTP